MKPCDKCHTRDAKVFLTQVFDGVDTTKMALCEVCAETIGLGGITLKRFLKAVQDGASPASLASEAFDQVAATRPEYSRDAFQFVRDGVDHAVRSLSRTSRQVTASELLDSLRVLALERYGSAARDQLRGWGVTRCEDFGEIVFTLIDNGLFGKRPEDRKEDFENGYDFATAFPATPEN
jgi:uncharacterized repeat protein (TIGR04138 family)